MTENQPEMQDFQFKRSPREWKYAPSYLGHYLQGLIVALMVPFPVMGIILAWYYMRYQENEHRRAKEVQTSVMAGLPVLGEWISRDIMDWMSGGWTGTLIQMGVIVYLVLRLV